MSNKLCNRTPSYLTIRNGIYYFCYRLPATGPESKSEIYRKSLRTSSLIEARKRSVKFLEIVERCKIHLPHTDIGTPYMEEKEHIRNLKKHFNTVAKIEGENLHLAFKGECCTIPRCFDERDDFFEQEIEMILTNIMNMHYQQLYDVNNQIMREVPKVIANFTEEARLSLLQKYKDFQIALKKQAFANFHNDISALQSLFHLLYKNLNEADEQLIEHSAREWSLSKVRSTEFIIQLLDLDYESLQLVVSKLRDSMKSQRRDLSAYEDMLKKGQEQEYLLSEAIQEFVAWDEDGRSRTIDNKNNILDAMNLLVAIIGDIPVTQITEDDVEQTIKFRRIMPKRNKKPYRDWSYEQTIHEIKNGEIDEEDLVASKTVKETFKIYQSFFSAFLLRNKKKIAVSPTTNIRVKAESAPYGSYTDKQMAQLLSHWEVYPEKELRMIFDLAQHYWTPH